MLSGNGKKPSLARIFARRYDSLIGLRDKGIRGIKSLGPSITGLKSNILTLGKHYFTISFNESQNTDLSLKLSSQVLFEFKDKMGNR